MALSRAKSRLHEALHSGTMRCTHDRESCRRDCRIEKQAAGSSSLNSCHAVFTHVVVESSHPPGSRRKLRPQFVRYNLNLLLWSSVYGLGSSLTSRAPVVWVLLKAIEPIALLVHPVNTSVALNIVAAYTSAADGTWSSP